MTFWEKAWHRVFGHLAKEIVTAKQHSPGSLDVTFCCECGHQWTRVFRTRSLTLSAWFHSIHREYSRKDRAISNMKLGKP